MAKLTPLEVAQNQALRGDTDAAVAAFEALADKGTPRAAAALAEIAGYRGHWDVVLDNIEKAFGVVAKIETFNVQSDLTVLAARAAREVGSWDRVARIADIGRQNLGKRGDPDLLRILAKLARFAAAHGSEAFHIDEGPQPDSSTRFAEALAKIDGKKKFRDAEARADHVFGLARVYDYLDGAVQIFDREATLPGIFDNAAFLAAALATAGQPNEAWAVIEARIDRWWPVEETQVAPVILLTNAALAPVMTPDRCAVILGTPRGPAVQ